MSRVYNFSAGPATLPLSVLEEARDELVDYRGSGVSIMECSHRGKEYMAVQEEAVSNVRELMSVPDTHEILLLQGGASHQFAMVPMNLLAEGQTADYTASGSWASKAIKEAGKIGKVHIAADCGKEIPTRVPMPEELQLTDSAAYVHITSNETISGAQWKTFPKTAAPLVADMSSDILSRPVDVSDFGLIYAGAQKNLGPSGVTLVIIRRDLAEASPEHLPAILRYSTHMEADSMYNTPPCFAIYMLSLTTRWLKQAGVEAVYEKNRAKAARLYDAIDATDFYSGTAVPGHRSDMNITFRIADESLEPVFLAEADKEGLVQLKGHRSVGGLRASIYNAFPEEGVDALVAFMRAFESRHG